MKVLYFQSTQQVKDYPRLDDKPVQGLDPDYLVLLKVEAAPPNYDPATETLAESWTVDLPSLEYRQGWAVEPLPPVAQWTAFNTAMLSDADWTPWITQNSLLTSATTMASLNQNLELLQTTIETAIAVLGQPDPVAAQRWQYIADANFIPIQFGEP